MMRNRISRTFPLLSLLIAFIASPAFAQGGSVTRIEQNDPSITYSGNWYSNASSLHSGGARPRRPARGPHAADELTEPRTARAAACHPSAAAARRPVRGEPPARGSYPVAPPQQHDALP